MRLALKWFLPVALAAMGLAWVSEQVALLLGFEPPPQDLVRLFSDPNVAWRVKARFAALALIAAPILEEWVFRMGLFRLFRWLWGKVVSPGLPEPDGRAAFPLFPALSSGAIFAAVHFHAATFVPLWFLGVAFAWLYWKSGTIRSPMLCHFLFNAINLALCLVMARFDGSGA